MTASAYKDSLWHALEATWDLCVLANQEPENIRCNTQQAWELVFKKSLLVDIDKTIASNMSTTNTRIFCTNIYGVQLNNELKIWVPFRHGHIDFMQFND